jgi:gamma-glutamyl:cysteine ligase YbdK (ATP-grasp superfamily)
MLEAAATSFQIHLQVAQEQAVRMFNAALIVSAPLVAISANAPYLFGHDLFAGNHSMA